MARRFMMSLASLRSLDPAACDNDMRLVWKDGDSFNLAVRVRTYNGTPVDTYELRYLSVCSSRELRLLAKQLEWYAGSLESSEASLEEFEPRRPGSC